MNYKILTAVSALALMSASQVAVAQNDSMYAKPRFVRANAANNPDTPPAAIITKEDIKRGWEDTKKAATETAEDIEYSILSDEPNVADTKISVRATTKGLLDRPVYSANNKHIGTMKDIIIDREGNAILAVVSEAKMLDLGAKETAFDYGMVLRRDDKGDVVMPVTEETIKNAREFSYNLNDSGKENMRTIPMGGYSVEKLLKAHVVNPAGESVASVDNITFRGGHIDALIVGFDKVMGMGGKQAALHFSDVKMLDRADGNVAFQMTASQAAQFEAFKQSASN